ncbi:OmpH family outer membrane protein [Lacinutrix sp. Hel_I_90]|uniref:OmpH family outer membrane protein n=1 Tax=Lacinutrix sp. Hel_I_90 TaxID=1249999 RepID=UPI0005C98125|nr:OmpH family outer membrane protein [Lacinutrix sp. Hel_I_90]
MKKNLPFINGLLIIGLILFIAFSYFSPQEKKQVYIDNIKLFNNFKMSKEMNLLHKNKIETQAKKVDSLYQLFQISIQEKKEDKLLQYNLQQENNKLEEYQNYFTTSVSDQVWQRLNGYINDYGELKKYDIILGTSGNGNIMYSKDEFNITEDIIIFANSKYEGVQ